MPGGNEINNQSLKDIEMIADDPEGKLTTILIYEKEHPSYIENFSMFK